MKFKYETLVGRYGQRTTEVLRDKPVTLPICPGFEQTLGFRDERPARPVQIKRFLVLQHLRKSVSPGSQCRPKVIIQTTHLTNNWRVKV